VTSSTPSTPASPQCPHRGQAAGRRGCGRSRGAAPLCGGAARRVPRRPGRRLHRQGAARPARSRAHHRPARRGQVAVRPLPRARRGVGPQRVRAQGARLPRPLHCGRGRGRRGGAHGPAARGPRPGGRAAPDRGAGEPARPRRTRPRRPARGGARGGRGRDLRGHPRRRLPRPGGERGRTDGRRRALPHRPRRGDRTPRWWPSTTRPSRATPRAATPP
jgi:hypothetical protein